MEREVPSESRRRGVASGAIGGSAGHAAMADTSRPLPELPAPNVKRWTIRRKAAVVIAVASGALTGQEACQRYELSEEELRSWQRAFENHGLPGLRSTRLQHYRGRSSQE